MPAIRDLVSSELRKLGYRNVVIASDGDEAWRFFNEATSVEPIGLIISDWNMPRMTGLEFLKKVRSHTSGAQTPFILLTAEGQKEQVLDAVTNGVSQYILKPFSSKQFEEKIRAAWVKSTSSKSA